MSNFRYIIPKILELITSHPRYIPKIEWSNELWTHNVFRVYEAIFGLRSDYVKPYMAAGPGIQIPLCLEAQIVLTEIGIRHALKFKWSSIRIVVNQQAMVTADGMVLPFSPYLFAVTFDAGGGGGAAGTSPRTWTHVNTGSDLSLVIGVISTGVFADNSTAASYNLVAATKRATQGDASTLIGTAAALWTLANPATGSNTVSVTLSTGNGTGWSVSFTGAGGGFDAANTAYNTVSAASIPTTITTVAANTRAVCVGVSGGGTPTIAGTFTQVAGVQSSSLLGWSGTYASAGVNTDTICTMVAGPNLYVIVSIAPTSSATTNGNFLGFMR